MQRNMRGLLASAVLLVGSLTVPTICAAQSQSAIGTDAPQEKASAPAPKKQGSEVQLLMKQIQLQQKQIGQLQESIARQQQLLKQLAAQETGSKPATTTSLPHTAQSATAAKAQPQNAGPLVASTAPPPLVSDSESNSLQTEPNPAIPNSPIAAEPLKIGRATLTPVGFVDATAFFRTRNLGSGIGGSFGSLPYSNSVQGHLSETRLTIQNSRFGLQFDSAFGGNTVRGYLETDFLGFQPVNAFVTSNSDSLRLRLYWLDLRRGKFEFLSGQSWSLLTPGRNGISPMPADIFFSQDMDTNYQVGLTWSRQLQFRFVYHATPTVAAALSLEDPEQYVGGAVALPGNFSATQVDTGGNTSTPNVVPDVIGKLAFDPLLGGKHMHVEFAGLLSTFKTFSSVLNSTSTAEGGGGSVNLNLELFKNFNLIGNTFYSDGGGRYVFGLAPDFIVRADGTPSLVHTDSAIGGFEYQATPKTLYYGYYGGVYIGRNASVASTSSTGVPTYVGYGYPLASSASPSQNRAIQEATFGIIQTFWKNAHYGALQLITQYSYLTRAPWVVTTGNPKSANLSEAYADIRYVLP